MQLRHRIGKCVFVGLIVCLLLPGVAGRAFAQGGRLTPQQEAWLRQIYMNRTGQYDQAYLESTNWASWRAANTNAFASILSSTNAWQLVTDWVESYSNNINMSPESGIWGLNADIPAIELCRPLMVTNAGMWTYGAGSIHLGNTNRAAKDPFWNLNGSGEVVLRGLD